MAGQTCTVRHRTVEPPSGCRLEVWSVAVLHPDEATTVEVEDVTADLAARRPEVLRRLLDLGVPHATLQLLLPGWEPFLAAAQDQRPAHH